MKFYITWGLRFIFCFMVLVLGTQIAIAADGDVCTVNPDGEAPGRSSCGDLEWTPPTQNVDGSPLTDLAGYVVYWRQDEPTFTNSTGQWPNLDLDASDVAYDVSVTVIGDYGDTVTVTYAVTAVDEQGNESAYSNEVSRAFLIVDDVFPMPPDLRLRVVAINWICRTPTGSGCGLIALN